MGRIDAWLLKRIIQKEVRQGPDHPRKITALFAAVLRGCREEFHEDNDPTLGEYCAEWFEAALDEVAPYHIFRQS